LTRAREVVSAMQGWEVGGESTLIREASALLRGDPPDLLACDLSFVDGSVERLFPYLHFWPQRPKILLLAHSAEELPLFDALRWGAHAYCVVQPNGAGLEAGLRRLIAGRAAMSPSIARRSLALFGLGRCRNEDSIRVQASRDWTPLGLAPGIALCEQHLLSLLASGMLANEIAALWELPEVEIERRLAAIYGRLHALLTHTQPDRMSA
jgi:DNA-binding NarL/FixJ family response regulator